MSEDKPLRQEPDDHEELRKRSGSVDTNDRLVSFLYMLLHDHLSAGVVEQLVCNAIRVERYLAQKTPPGISEVSNGWLALYAKDLAERLVPGRHDEHPDVEAVRAEQRGRVINIPFPSPVALANGDSLEFGGSITFNEETREVISGSGTVGITRANDETGVKEHASWNVGLTTAPAPASESEPPLSYGVPPVPETVVDTEHEIVEPEDRKPRSGG